MKKIYNVLSIILLLLIVCELCIILKIGVLRVLMFSGLKSIFLLGKSMSGKMEFILTDENSKPLNRIKFDSIVETANGNFIVRKNSRYGVINNNGKIVIPVKYGSMSYNNGYFTASDKIYKSAYDYVAVQSGNKKGCPDKYYFFDTNTYKIILTLRSSTKPTVYDKDIIGINLKGKTVFVNKKGKNYIKQNYDNISFLSYVSKNDTDYLGKTVRIEKNKKFGIINLKGENIIPAEYDKIERISVFGDKKNDDYLVKKDNKWGIVNQQGKITVPAEYDEISIANDEISVKKNGKWGIIDYNNNLILDFISDDKIYRPVYNKKLYCISEERKEQPVLPTTDAPKQIIAEKPKKKPNSKQEQYNIEGELHVISVYKGQTKEAGYYMYHPLGYADVSVEIKNKPVTIVLSSYEPVLWHINAVKGANIKKIYILGYHDSDVIPPNSDIYVDKMNNRLDYLENNIDKVEQILGKKPSSLQFQYAGNSFIIDGIEGTSPENPTKSSVSEVSSNKSSYNSFRPQISKRLGQKSTDKEVKLLCNDYESECKISELNEYNALFDNNFYIVTNKYYKKGSGKYYFEATYVLPPGQKMADMSVGIVSGDLKYVYNGFFGQPKNNDTIGVAVDFNNGKIKFYINGILQKEYKSRYKEKSTLSKKELMIPKFFKNDGREYTAAIWSQRNSKITVNFGAVKFKYKMPEGYKPYDEYSANKNKVNI